MLAAFFSHVVMQVRGSILRLFILYALSGVLASESAPPNFCFRKYYTDNCTGYYTDYILGQNNCMPTPIGSSIFTCAADLYTVTQDIYQTPGECTGPKVTGQLSLYPTYLFPDCAVRVSQSLPVLHRFRCWYLLPCAVPVARPAAAASPAAFSEP